MRQKGPHRERTLLDVLDRVLDKSIVVEAVGLDARVDIVTDLDERRVDASAH